MTLTELPRVTHVLSRGMASSARNVLLKAIPETKLCFFFCECFPEQRWSLLKEKMKRALYANRTSHNMWRLGHPDSHDGDTTCCALQLIGDAAFVTLHDVTLRYHTPCTPHVVPSYEY